MSSAVFLNINNTSSSTILVCARGGVTCSTITALECRTINNTTIESKAEGRLNVVPSNNSVCLSIFSTAATADASPLASGILRTSTKSASFDLSWDGSRINLMNSQCNTRPSATVDKVKNIEVIIINTLTNATVSFCNHQEAADCTNWDFNCNPCGRDGTVIQPSSVGRTQFPTDTSSWCLALWVTPGSTVPVGSNVTPCVPANRKPAKTITINPSTASPPQSGLQIIVSGTAANPTFDMTVLYSCDAIPFAPLTTAPTEESFFRRFWWLILIVIIIIIIIIIVVAWSSSRKTETPGTITVHNYRLPTAVAPSTIVPSAVP